MNKEVKAKWLEALRSGEYEQTQGRLTNKDGTAFCCLGVLCDIYAQETKGAAGFVQEPAGGLIFEDLSGAHNSGTLTSEVRAWAHLPVTSESYDVFRLMDMNDRGYSFIDIADRIEENL